MNKRTPYQLLNLPPTATEEEIRQVYRRLAKRYHPDCNPGKPDLVEQFREIQMAYEMLLNGGGKNNRGMVACSEQAAQPTPYLTDPFWGFYRIATDYLRRNRIKVSSPSPSGDGNETG